MFETDTTDYSFDSLLAWIKTPAADPLSKELAYTHYLLMHPKITFLKTLPTGDTLFDLGAGTGALIGFRQWCGFPRKDLKFVGASLVHGQHTPEYDEFFIGNLDVEKPNFANTPQHVFSSGCIEHLKSPDGMLEWVGSILPKGGLIYLDWPAPHSVNIPSRSLFAEAGYNVTCMNFHDDSTHVTAYPIEDIAERLVRNGFRIKSAGYVDMPFLADAMKHHGVESGDNYFLSMALWLKTRFTVFVIAEKI